MLRLRSVPLSIVECLTSHGLPTDTDTTGVTCPITMVMNKKKYICTVSHGEARMLQAPGSKFFLDIPEGSDGVYMTAPHTDHPIMRNCSIVPDNECIISAVIEVLHFQRPSEQKRSSGGIHLLKIPHCVTDENSLKHVKVRKGNTFQNSKFKELPRMNVSNTGDCFTVDNKFITIYTNTFSEFVCTICKNICQANIQVLLFGSLEPLVERQLSWVKLKSFFCCPLFNIREFTEVSSVVFCRNLLFVK